jgi:hypothetical protein
MEQGAIRKEKGKSKKEGADFDRVWEAGLTRGVNNEQLG